MFLNSVNFGSIELNVTIIGLKFSVIFPQSLYNVNMISLSCFSLSSLFSDFFSSVPKTTMLFCLDFLSFISSITDVTVSWPDCLPFPSWSVSSFLVFDWSLVTSSLTTSLWLLISLLSLTLILFSISFCTIFLTSCSPHIFNIFCSRLMILCSNSSRIWLHASTIVLSVTIFFTTLSLQSP